MSSSDNKRIAKNTLFLYVRMFVMMAVSLFTSRIVLDKLGEQDYGIYNLIGGIVLLVSFISNGLINSSQRFMNFHLGKNDEAMVNKVFCTSMNTYIIFSVVFLIVAETGGLYFVNHKLNIPEDRFYAANVVYQFSILTFIISLLRVPYNSIIVAYEKMDFFAYISLIEVVMKLALVYLLCITSSDRLILFAALSTLTPLIINVVYRQFCRKKIETAFYKFILDLKLLKEMIMFSLWSLTASFSYVVSTQTLNIFVNHFCGVAVNAAVALATQINTQLNQFIQNFQIAVTPQTVKLYAADEKEEYRRLVYRTSKFSFFLFFIITCLFCIRTDFLFGLWLVEVPEYSVILCQLMTVFTLVETLSYSLWIAVQATGNIKKFQIWTSISMLTNIPLSYYVLWQGMPVYSAFMIRIAISGIVLGVRLFYMCRYECFSFGEYFSRVLKNIFLVILIVVPLLFFFSERIGDGLFDFVLIEILTLFVCCGAIYLLGLDKAEKDLVVDFAKSKMKILHKNK